MVAELALACSLSLSVVLRWVHWWHSQDVGIADVPESLVFCKLNGDYDMSDIDGARLAALVGAWQSGGISHGALIYQLGRGEGLPPGRRFGGERAAIRANPPPGGGK